MVDLHMHSTASDGTLTPEELLKEAHRKSLKIISLTDHDTLNGLEEIKKNSKKYGIEIINGIEFSTEYLNKEVHILGYFFDEKNLELLDIITKLKQERIERTKRILKKLEKYKIYITFEELLKEVKGDLIGRAHIANAMLKKGYVYSKNEAFKIYLKTGGLASEPKNILNAIEAIKIIKKSGGIVSLAHPKLIGFEKEGLEKLVGILKEAGLDAMEVYYPEHSEKETEEFKKLCKKYTLLYTGGSDFHGTNRPEAYLGMKGINEKEFEILKRCAINLKNDFLSDTI